MAHIMHPAVCLLQFDTACEWTITVLIALCTLDVTITCSLQSQAKWRGRSGIFKDLGSCSCWSSNGWGRGEGWNDAAQREQAWWKGEQWRSNHFIVASWLCQYKNMFIIIKSLLIAFVWMVAMLGHLHSVFWFPYTHWLSCCIFKLWNVVQHDCHWCCR